MLFAAFPGPDMVRSFTLGALAAPSVSMHANTASEMREHPTFTATRDVELAMIAAKQRAEFSSVGPRGMTISVRLVKRFA